MTQPGKKAIPKYKFWKVAESVTRNAFLTIPYFGTQIADYYTNTIVPICSGPRDRCTAFIVRVLKAAVTAPYPSGVPSKK